VRRPKTGLPITPAKRRLMVLTDAQHEDKHDVITESPRTPTQDVAGCSQMISPRGDGDLDTPTAAGRRKTRLKKEAEATALMLGASLESQEEKDAREQRETQELFSNIQSVLLQNPELEPKYQQIISSAGEMGAQQTYLQLHKLMTDHEDVQEMLLDLLSEEDALSLGMTTYSDFAERQRFKRFLYKLNIVYKHQPAYHIKVLKELDVLSKDESLTSEKLKEISCQLFRNNQHLMEEFQMLIPGIAPPASMLSSAEHLVLPEDNDTLDQDDQMEQIFVPRSPEADLESSSSNIRFSQGRCYVMEGKMMKAATVNKVPMLNSSNNSPPT